MPTNPDTNDERLKLHEAIGATAVVFLAAGAIAITFALLVAHCLVVETINHLNPKEK